MGFGGKCPRLHKISRSDSQLYQKILHFGKRIGQPSSVGPRSFLLQAPSQPITMAPQNSCATFTKGSMRIDNFPSASGTSTAPSAGASARSKGPDFVGVGVHRSGTTWLADMLAQHPGVFIPRKELSFFVRFYRKGYRWYHRWFAHRGVRLAGELTPSYMISPRPDSTRREFYPHWNPRRALLFWQGQPSARDELKARYPDIRVFAIFRNPVDRAWSHYWYWRERKERLGKRVVPFEKMWADDGRWIRTYGLYGDYLAYWQAKFPDFGVFFYEDIASDPVRLIQSVYRFLGADDNFVPQNYGRNNRKGTYAAMPASLRAQLREFYRPQILRFAALTGRDLSHWLRT